MFGSSGTMLIWASYLIASLVSTSFYVSAALLPAKKAGLQYEERSTPLLGRGPTARSPPTMPNDGVTRKYEWTISRGTTAPDGVTKPALLVNNQFPGPLLEANWGDTFEITVHNNISDPAEGTILHWHGLLQTGTPWADGAPAVDLCPIAPGTSFTYTFKADPYGTSWWHSHYSAQLVDGLFGPMIIHGPKSTDYDIDIGPVLLSDNYHQPYHDYIEMTSGLPFQVAYSDSNLINGKMSYNCSLITDGQACKPNAPISEFYFEPGKVHLLRLINSGAEGLQYFSIDGHSMTIVANDFVPVVPYETEFVTLGVGQRTDILVKGLGNPKGAYWMRANVSTVCSPANSPLAVAAIYYPEADTSKSPSTTSSVKPFTETCINDDLSKNIPYYKQTPPSSPATTKQVDVVLGTNSSGNTLFFLNGVSFRGDYNAPVLLLAKTGNLSYPYDPEWNVYNFGTNSSIRLVVTNTSPLSHPIHLHGHIFWVLAQGTGTWDGAVQNTVNPPRRDVHLLPAGSATDPGYVVLEFNANNPGVWPFHCHISWHVSTGFYATILYQPAKIQKLDFPSSLAQVCRSWAQFTGKDVVDQIDSGL